MGLVLSIRPCEGKMLSKFGLLHDELCWNLDAIYYALDLRDEMEFKWNDSRCRYMLVKKDSMTGVAAIGELTESDRLDYEKHDRDHFLRNLMDESILAQEKNSWIRRFTRQNDSQAVHKFAKVLKKRMQQVFDLSKDTCSDQSFSRIDHLDLKTKNKLSGESKRLVYKGEWCGQVVAIGISKYATEVAVQSEAALMLKVQHPHIVEFYGWAFTENAPPPASSGEDDVVSAGYLVMEWMERDLRREIDRCKRSRERSVGPFPLAVAVDILLQIVGAMIHMHNLGIMHRDLKAANCLVSLRSLLKSSAEVLDFYTVKLIDFGDSKVLKAEMTVQTVNKGTRWWMAPEVWQVEGEQLKQYTKSADVYSFGVTCYEVITGLVPFEEFRHSPSSLRHALNEGTRPRIPPTCPAGFQQLMSKCWAQVPDARPNFKDIQKELWTIKGSLEQ
ncbi:hypothetical protein KC19_4G108600 [Ceratodon purpureus]|uniref:Protein kinase domain-containing protein n=1 Tax=Ceratodon purpureus TaxID=3225 RepID=A0A8T0I9E2_CERPU|nr:hypothetical protein KC19_4G108600 [Ceratodon purpureus]